MIRTYDCIRAEPPSDAPRFAPPPLHLDLLPSMVDLRPYMPPVYDQGRLGSCTGNAWAGLVQSLRRANRPKVADWVPSRLFIYYGERALEGHVRQDAGAAIADGAKVLTHSGVCPEENSGPTRPAASPSAPPPPPSPRPPPTRSRWSSRSTTAT
jgi:C1A family cysteine protease